MKHSFIFLFLAFFSLVSCHNMGGDNVETIESLSTKLESDPHNISLLRKRVELYKTANNNDKAIADLQHCVNLAPDSASFYIELANLFMTEGNVNNTLALLEKASQIDPKNVDIWLQVSEIYLMYKKYSEVIKFANKALDIDPYSDKAFFIKGYAFKESGSTDIAIRNFQQCLKNNPNNYNANIELGAIYSKLKNELAITCYNNAIAIDSANINSYYNLGLFYQNNDFLNEAISTYKILIKKDSTFPNSYYNIGYIYLELLKINDMAASYFSKAIEAKPDYKEAYFNRGLSFEEVGNIMQAQQDYKSSLRIDPDYRLAIDGLNRVEESINSN